MKTHSVRFCCTHARVIGRQSAERPWTTSGSVSGHSRLTGGASHWRPAQYTTSSLVCFSSQLPSKSMSSVYFSNWSNPPLENWKWKETQSLSQVHYEQLSQSFFLFRRSPANHLVASHHDCHLPVSIPFSKYREYFPSLVCIRTLLNKAVISHLCNDGLKHRGGINTTCTPRSIKVKGNYAKWLS